MSNQSPSEFLIAPTSSNMIPFPAVALREADGASRDGADSGIDMKIQQRAQQETNEGTKLPPTRHNTSTRGSNVGLPPDRVVTSSIMGRYSTELPSQQKFVRLSTVSARNSLRHPRTFYQPIQSEIDYPRRNISWYEATESRPPLRIDMSGPSPTTYSPCNKPLYETNAPAYSFGRKEIEKAGSGQKAWGKLWFRSHSPFTFKTNYELHWPSPFHYQHKSTLGPKQVNKPAFPSHSIGTPTSLQPPKHKARMTVQPVPTIYYPEVVALSRMRRAPAHTMGSKLQNRNWTPIMDVPAPNMYNPLKSILITKPTQPAYTVCGFRKDKRHDVGPFFTL
ncbi:protein STPG3-like [Styela clava]|uniref:protein STPG3-like n=1 Tax=Styela clava TaxID=7725 RepID=UPI00193A87D1|nr:protein STPG3-like [Styela clava]